MSEAEASGIGAECVDAGLDVPDAIDAERFDAAINVLAADGGGEGSVFEFFDDTGGREGGDAIGPDLAAGDDEAGELIDGEEGGGHGGRRGDAGVGGVGEDGLTDVFVDTELFEVPDADEGVFVARRVAFVIEVVEEAGDDPPVALGGVEAVGAGGHAGGDAFHVLSQGGAGGPFVHQRPGLIGSHDRSVAGRAGEPVRVGGSVVEEVFEDDVADGFSGDGIGTVWHGAGGDQQRGEVGLDVDAAVRPPHERCIEGDDIEECAQAEA